MNVSAQILPARPIIFSALMLKALLAGRKTQTRRVMKPQPEETPYSNTDMGESWPEWDWWGPGCERREEAHSYDEAIWHCPYGRVGDYLWVRENLQRGVAIGALVDGEPQIGYSVQHAASYTAVPYNGVGRGWCGRALWDWKRKFIPSIHMPRWASRFTLELTDVRMEPVQNISADDAIAEGLATWTSPAGVTHYGIDTPDVWEPNPVSTYARLWDKINGEKHPWKSNPWVWALTFKVME